MNFWRSLSSQFKPFLVLAPMEGVTDWVFREIIAGAAKPDVLFTEFTNVDALLSKGYEKTIPRFRYSEKERPIVAQIWGVEPKSFFQVAKMVKALGFDGIDINMGCPVRAVLKMGAGACHINNSELAGKIIQATKEGAGGIPVSVKTRIGVHKIVTDEWIQFLLEQKIDALTIHGRTAKELSKVPAHWDEIGKAVKIRNRVAPQTAIIGNGDIVNLDQAKEAHATHGVDGAMIGKGVFHNPWVFERSPRLHTTKEFLEVLLLHTKLYTDTYPGERRFAPMKKYFKIYVRAFSGANALLVALMETKNFSEVEQLVAPYMV